MDPATLEAGLVRIFGAGGSTSGAGFLITRDLALTCAHVLAAAAGQRLSQPPRQGFRIDFPLAAPGQMVPAGVIAWLPPGRGEDLALLQLPGRLPAGTAPLPLSERADLWGHRFRTFGFPAGHPDGVWADGRILGRQAAGWLQIEDIGRSGYFVRAGFSGAPVWDENLGVVIGIVAAADRSRRARTAFIITAAAIRKALPGLDPGNR